MSSPKSVFGYIRASTAEQIDTLAAQETKIKNYCTFKGLTLLDTYIDSGVSGSIDFKDRPQSREILKKLQEGEGDGVVVCKIDRLSRNSADFIKTLDYFNKNYIAFFCIEPDIDTTSFAGKFFCQIMAAMAEMELNMIRQRTKDVLEQKKRNNECIGSVPFGYSKTDDKKLELNEEEQQIIQVILDQNALGMSNNKICFYLMENGIKNRTREKWFPETIKRILAHHGIKKEKKRERREKII